jgi:hypothetical protein
MVSDHDSRLTLITILQFVARLINKTPSSAAGSSEQELMAHQAQWAGDYHAACVSLQDQIVFLQFMV